MTPEQAKALREPFPKSAIGKLPKAGMQLDYVGHAAVTDRLLSVDPDWSWTPFALDANGLPALDRAGNLWIFLTVCGVTRPGVGDGKNAKECISDAIRNAAMRFGVALDLWSKEELHPDESPKKAVESDPPRIPAQPEASEGASGTLTPLARFHQLAEEYGAIVPAFDVTETKRKAIGKDQGWLGRQCEAFEANIAAKKAELEAEKNFPIPAGARTA